MKKGFVKIFIVFAMITVIFSLSSCFLLNSYLDSSASTDDMGFDKQEGLQISSVDINSSGELIITYTNGSKHNLGCVVGQDGSVNVDIQGNSNDASFAVAKGLRSAVSIQCTHTVYNKYGIPTSAGSAGSGIIYKIDKETNSAFIITNFHVVYNESSLNDNGISDDINVFLYGSEYADMRIPATYVGGSNNYDIAVLRVDNCEYLNSNVFIEPVFADSNKTYAGQSAIAVGNPDGAGISASYGVVSVYSERITLNIGGAVSLRVMRIDTPVNSGNSGGGLYNEKGELIGIVNAKTSDTSLENIGYAIPSNIVKAVADNIIDHCYGTDLERVQRALLNITVGISASNAYLTEDGHVMVKETVFVSEVNKDGIAYGKLKKNDILISAKLNDKEIEITQQYEIIDFLLNARVGDTLYITVERQTTQGVENITVEIPITKDAINEY
ncbi:MAG: trypsin-like peptidase domain-containing protein [Clostridia bacterium]|nr:trypsin-like peptidase domain-containing protein [Clostridia bacterium]